MELCFQHFGQYLNVAVAHGIATHEVISVCGIVVNSVVENPVSITFFSQLLHNRSDFICPNSFLYISHLSSLNVYLLEDITIVHADKNTITAI